VLTSLLPNLDTVRLSPPLTHACMHALHHHHHHTKARNSDSSTPWLQLSRVRRSTCLDLAQDVDVQLSTSQSRTRLAAMGLRSRLFLTLPLPAGVVGFDVSLHCIRACMDPRLERISPSIPSPIPIPFPKLGHLPAALHASFLRSSTLPVCLPRTSRGISRFPLPSRAFGRRGCCIRHQCICPIGTAPD
jgi:hypothetical protein